MAVVNEVVTQFSFKGDLKPQRDYNKGLTDSIKLLSGMAAGLTAVSGAMFAWASSIFSTLDPVAQLSYETGVSAEAIQELGFVAMTSGSSAQALQSSLAGLSKTMGDASRGLGSGKQVFEDLGISVTDTNGQVKKADVMLDELRNRFNQLDLSMDQRRSIAASLGLDQSMVQLLSKTNEEMDTLRERAQKLGVVTQEQIDAVADYNTSLDVLKFGMQGIQNMVAVGFAPAMGELVDKFVGLLEANHELIVSGLTWLGEVITGTVGMLQRMWPVLAGIAAGFVIAKIAAIGFGGVMGVILSPIVLITAAIVAAILIVDDLIVAFQGGESVIADFFEAFFGIDIRPALRAIVDAVKDMIDFIINLFAPAVDAIMSMFKAVVALLKGDFSGAWGHITDALSSAIEFWIGMFDAWRDAALAVIHTIINILVAGFTAAFDKLAEIFQSWTDWIKGLFGRMLDGITGMWGKVTDYLKNKMLDILPDWAIKLIGGGDSSKKVDEAAVRKEAEAATALSVGLDRDTAVDRSTTQQSWNSNIDQNVEIHIATNDPARAGAAVQDALQQQLQDARTMSKRGGM